MAPWPLIWKIAFVVVLTVFAGMSVWVTVGGWQDIRTLLKKLNDDGPDSNSDDPSGGDED
jgi:hypothetical protein